MIRLAVRLARLALLVLTAAPAAAAAPPHRVVSFNVCADQLVLALADPEQIAALSPYATDATISVVADKARGFRQVPLQAEAVIPLKPDLVLTGPNYRLTEPILRALGIPVAKVDLIPSVAAATAQIRTIATLLGHPERGEALVAKLDAARRRLDAAPRPLGATALLVGNGGYTEGPASLAGALLREAGFRPPPGAPPGFGGVVPLEKLIALRPDYLVVSSLIEEANGQGALYLTHPALRALYPPSRRILLPERYTMCGGPSLVAAFDYLAGVVSRLARD